MRCYVLPMNMAFAQSEWWTNPPVTGSFPVNITVCTQVTFMYEWIEYHAILGVTKFVVYDAGSKGELKKLRDFYKQKRGPGFVVVIPTKFNDQAINFRDCVSRFSNQTQWFGIFDNDEFCVLSDKSKVRIERTCEFNASQQVSEQTTKTSDLTVFLGQIPERIGRIYVLAARFGSSPVVNSAYTVKTTKNGRMFLVPRELHLVTEDHSLRGPWRELDGEWTWARRRFSSEFATLCNETDNQVKQDGTRRICGHGLGKSFFRASAAWLGNPLDDPWTAGWIHSGRFVHRFPTHPRFDPYSDYVPPQVFRLHHYDLRNPEEAKVQNGAWVGMSEVKMKRVQAKEFFNSVKDQNATCHLTQLRQRMSNYFFSPNLTATKET